MSQENVEIVRRVYEGWARGDFSEGGVFDPEVEFEMPDGPEGASTRGFDAMRLTWQAGLNAWDDSRAEPTRFIDAGKDVIVVLNHIQARGKGSGAAVDADTATVWRLDAGKGVSLALYWDNEKAVEAAGLWEDAMTDKTVQGGILASVNLDIDV